jgi:hypothetical protein
MALSIFAPGLNRQCNGPEGVKGFGRETLTMLILQVPPEVYYSVGRCAGQRLEREAIGRLAFHNKMTVGFRQFEQERRTESQIGPVRSVYIKTFGHPFIP